MYVFSTTRCRDDLTGMYMYSASYLLLCELAYMIGDAEWKEGNEKWTGSLLGKDRGRPRICTVSLSSKLFLPSSFLSFQSILAAIF